MLTEHAKVRIELRELTVEIVSRWREMSESEFRMPPTCPERREGSSQIGGLATRSIRAYALQDTFLALSRQRLVIEEPNLIVVTALINWRPE